MQHIGRCAMSLGAALYSSQLTLPLPMLGMVVLLAALGPPRPLPLRIGPCALIPLAPQGIITPNK